MGMSDDCYRSVYQEEDAEGHRGVRLSKRIMQIAGDALKRNITTLGPLVLPLSEQLRFFANLLARKAVRGQLPPLRPRAARSLVALPLLRSLVGYRDPASLPPADADAASAHRSRRRCDEAHSAARARQRAQPSTAS